MRLPDRDVFDYEFKVQVQSPHVASDIQQALHARARDYVEHKADSFSSRELTVEPVVTLIGQEKVGPPWQAPQLGERWQYKGGYDPTYAIRAVVQESDATYYMLRRVNATNYYIPCIETEAAMKSSYKKVA